MSKKTTSKSSKAAGRRPEIRSASPRRRTRMIALEPRMLFDGALGLDLGAKATALVLGDQSAAAADAAAPAPATPEATKDSSSTSQSQTQNTVTAQQQSASATPAEKDAAEKPGAEALDAASKPAEAKEVVFVDSRVTDYKSQLAGVDSKATVIFLDAGKDGVTQIADALSQYSD